MSVSQSVTHSLTRKDSNEDDLDPSPQEAISLALSCLCREEMKRLNFYPN